MNKLVIDAQISSVATLRYTPAGIPVLSLTLTHSSEQLEAEMLRSVDCTLNALILGSTALQKVSVGQRFRITGFLAPQSLKIKRLVLHVQSMKSIF